MHISGVKRTKLWLCVFVMAMFPLLNIVFYSGDTAQAAQITARKLTLKQAAGETTGGSAPTNDANYEYSFTIVTTASIRSIGLLFCDSATDSGCAADGTNKPTGIDVSTGVTLNGSSTGLGGSPSYTPTGAGNNYGCVAFSSDPSTGIVFQLDDVNNPSVENTTFFTRISTHTSADCTGGSTDTGVVAASTTRTITVTGVMPEYLLFCTGSTTDATCSTIGTGSVSFNQEFDPTDTATATSQMTAATNASTGYAITVTGTTLTSGSDTIAQAGATQLEAATNLNSSVWGINLVANTAPIAVGAGESPTSDGATSDLWFDPEDDYNDDGFFALDLTTPDVIAESDFGDPGNGHPTFAQVATVTYFANVSAIQPAGTYVATLNYVCTATF